MTTPMMPNLSAPTSSHSASSRPVVAVTGADGFIGSHLTEQLVQAGYHVKAMAIYNSQGSYGWLDTVGPETMQHVEVQLGDVRDSGSVRALMQGAQIVYHLAALIASDGVGKYQGVILTDSALTFQSSPGFYSSALDTSEWATLFEYEKAYRVRQLALYGAPTTVPEDYGLRVVSGTEFATGNLNVTAAGKNAFKDLTGNSLPLRNAYTYTAQLEAVTGVVTQPLLTDDAGRIVAATSTFNGRERLILTSAQSPYLLHTQILSYGLVQWLTKGVHLGEHRRFLQVDIDDWFLNGSVFDPATGGLRSEIFRLSASDALSVRDQQRAIDSAYNVVSNFKYAMMFNGRGAVPSSPTTCSPELYGDQIKDGLTSVSRCMASDFDWVNHTRDHLRMDVMDLPTATTAIVDNFAIGTQLGLQMSRKSLVTGEHSGLGYMDPTDDGTNNTAGFLQPKQDLGLGRSNPNLITAAVNSGVRYLASNHSIASQWDARCPSCGVPHPMNPSLLLVPRYPNSLAYHVTTPEEATASYNSLYAPGGAAAYWDHALDYAELLEVDSTRGVGHVFDGTAWPTYMHQTNLREYAPGKSLATDWVKAVVEKYARYSTLPLNTLRWDALGAFVERNTREQKALAANAYTAIWNRTFSTVRITPVGASVPFTLTGLWGGKVYGAYEAYPLTIYSAVDVIVRTR
ncbi:GDP-mannose 4,6-dehydratase [Deinococcus sp. QL22]|uniref:GDP-mannose 4,6-dehydratase n=1 Tax=Deinococcus sp. QL22 TaxID=2939437 RepID=UPI0020183880|nr:GDP-mannose 4,6-dehydratase [Deinococcus sp. QL22]UQN05968.1 GDP-mannose 4,6-dehydratase [Deinococcus sp. QL22]